MAHLGEHTVQGMSELVQESLHLPQGEEGRLGVGRLGEVHHHAHHGTAVLLRLLVYPLLLVVRHPRPTLLGRTREEIRVEHGQERIILIAHLPSLYVGVIDRYVLTQVEGDAIETGGQSEDTLLDAAQFEVGPQHLGIDVIAFHLEQVTVVGEVPGHEAEVLPLAAPGQCLHLSHLLACHG